MQSTLAMPSNSSSEDENTSHTTKEHVMKKKRTSIFAFLKKKNGHRSHDPPREKHSSVCGSPECTEISSTSYMNASKDIMVTSVSIHEYDVLHSNLASTGCENCLNTVKAKVEDTQRGNCMFPQDDDDSIGIRASMASLMVDSLDDSKDKKKNVSFRLLSIREYDLVLGDNPSCGDGPPVSLGWHHKDDFVIDINDYELVRKPRRTMAQLRMSSDLRRQIIWDGKKKYNRDIRRLERRIYKDQRKRNSNKFFTPPIEVED